MTLYQITGFNSLAKRNPEYVTLYNKDNTDVCPQCGCDEIIVGDSRVWCANESCSQILSETIRVGLIEGRHPMPVDCYLLPSFMTEERGFHQDAYNCALEAALDFVAENGSFVLYLTGLTVAALGAVDGMRKAGIKMPVCMNYDKATDSYVKVVLTGS